MSEFTSPDRCAAYANACAALIAFRTVAGSWPLELAAWGDRAAADVVDLTVAAIGHDHGSLGRRRCVRDAITRATYMTAVIDDALAMGFGNLASWHLQRVAGRSVVLLGMLLHADTALPADYDAGDASDPLTARDGPPADDATQRTARHADAPAASPSAKRGTSTRSSINRARG